MGQPKKLEHLEDPSESRIITLNWALGEIEWSTLHLSGTG